MQIKIFAALLAIWVFIAISGMRLDDQTLKETTPKEIAVTFDDLILGGPQIPVDRIEVMTEKILSTIREVGIPAVGFVNEKKLYFEGEVDERIGILKMWVVAGIELGNHTYSHASLQTTPLAEFQEDVIRGETVTASLLAKKDMKIRYFRHPYLKTGPALEVREAFEQFLQERGYSIAPVTIENLDWMFNAVYMRAQSNGDDALMKRAGTAYLDFTAKMFDFYERVSIVLFGYQIRHILLLHANELNADYFDDVVKLIRDRGYTFITLEQSLQDNAYSQPDTYAGPAGVSWLWRWDFSKGIRINWREEPEPPEFIQELYQRFVKDY